MMKMEHNFYKEAIADIKLSNEEGMEMVENAIKRREQKNRRLRVQAAVLASVLAIGFGTNGICYAQTGQNVWEFFGSTMYQNSQRDEVTAIAENSVISGETIEDGNRKYTLEYYWYDAEHGEAYFAIRTDSLDHTPLQTDAEDYLLCPVSEVNEGSIDIETSEPVLSEDQMSVWRYYHLMYAYSHNGKNSDEMVIGLNVKDGGITADGCETYRQIGAFALEPTGEMKCRYADGSGVLDGCLEIRISGAGVKINLDRNLELELKEAGGDPETTDITPFHFMDIQMEDGTVYHILGDLPEGDNMIWDETTGKGIGYIHQGEIVTGESYLGAVRYGGGFDGENTSGWESIFTTTFANFIDVDAITGVYLDGVELPLK